MKHILIIIAVTLLPLSAFAQAVHSANGFKCAKDSATVMCAGTFPRVKGKFAAIGNHSVIIKYEFDGYDFQYDSLEGCLMEGDQRKQEVRATNRNGKSKKFKSVKQAVKFCRSAK